MAFESGVLLIKFCFHTTHIAYLNELQFFYVVISLLLHIIITYLIQLIPCGEFRIIKMRRSRTA